MTTVLFGLQGPPFCVACLEPEDDSPPACTYCGGDMTWEECDQCDEGYTPVGLLHECEPDWYDEDDVEPCEQCESRGGWWTCLSQRCSLERLAALGPVPRQEDE